jgi:DNA-binding NarL/FixJ family response regulator
MHEPARPIRILIAEDHLIARAGMGAIISAQPDMTVVAEAVNGEQALALYRLHVPNVTLMDVRMPVMNGVQAAGAILAEFPQARIVALSTFGGDEDIRRALQSGVSSYLTKDVLHDELLAAIRSVHCGNHYFTAAVLAALAASRPHTDLSSREIEVLRLIVQGSGNKQIAHTLHIAEDTAKNHVKSILRKLGAADRTEAATMAIRRGIVHLQV